MKFDKRLVSVFALVSCLGLATIACDDGDDKKDGNTDGKKDDSSVTCTVTKDSCEAKGQEFDEANCKCNTVKSETCNDGVLDDNEICDVKDNNLLKKDDKFTCQFWFDANKEQMKEGVTLVEDAEAAPKCGEGCTSLKKGDCRTSADVLCGNGQIDEGEVCDPGIDGKSITFKKTDASCTDFAPGEYEDGGVPGCAKDCNGYAEGTCVGKGNATGSNGILSCKATLSEADKKITGSVEASAAEEKAVTGKVICALKTSKLDAIVKNAELGEIGAVDYDGSSLKEGGEYGCFYYVKAEGNSNGAFCSADGSVKKLSEVDTVADVTLVGFTVESQVASGVLAKWAFSDENVKLNEVLPEGLAAEDGSAKDALSLKWVAVGDDGSDIQVKRTAENSDTHALTALQLTTSGAEGKYGATQKAEESSHLAISGLTGYSVSSLKMTVKYEDAKVYVTQVASEAETVVKELSLGKDYSLEEVTGFAADASAINLYFDNGSKKAFAMDDLTIEGAAN